jgi:hypothetical protein
MWRLGYRCQKTSIRPPSCTRRHGWPWTYGADDKFFVDRPGETGYRSTAVWSFTEDFRWFAPVNIRGRCRGARDVVIVQPCRTVAETTTVCMAVAGERSPWPDGDHHSRQFVLTTMRDYQNELTAMRKLSLMSRKAEGTIAVCNISGGLARDPWLRTAVATSDSQVVRPASVCRVL